MDGLRARRGSRARTGLGGKDSIENVTRRSNAGAADGDGPCDAAVVQKARFKARFYWLSDAIFFTSATMEAAEA
jgi:hypothetical protein